MLNILKKEENINNKKEEKKQSKGKFIPNQNNK